MTENSPSESVCICVCFLCSVHFCQFGYKPTAKLQLADIEMFGRNIFMLYSGALQLAFCFHLLICRLIFS